MESVDIFYITISVAFAILVGFLCFAIYQFAQTLKAVQGLLDRIDDTAKDITLLKDGIKLGVLGIISKVIGKSRGGEAYE